MKKQDLTRFVGLPYEFPGRDFDKLIRRKEM